VLAKYGVELIGANERAIKVAEDRKLFGRGDGAHRARGAAGADRARRGKRPIDLRVDGFPAIIRPSFTLGGSGGGIAYNREEYEQIVRRGLDLSPCRRCSSSGRSSAGRSSSSR
jgi:carbamoyl-phosphate synthase large subunit